MMSGTKPKTKLKSDSKTNSLTLTKCQNLDSDLLYYGGILRFAAEIAKWYGGRLENGYAQACRGSNPFLSANPVIYHVLIPVLG